MDNQRIHLYLARNRHQGDGRLLFPVLQVQMGILLQASADDFPPFKERYNGIGRYVWYHIVNQGCNEPQDRCIKSCERVAKTEDGRQEGGYANSGS